MLTPGQQIHNLKNEYIRRHLARLDDDWDKRQEIKPVQKKNEPGPDPPHEDTQNHSSPAELGQDFKLVGKHLKLDQSTITPNKENIANQRLEDLAVKSDQVLLKVSTFWPFTFFVNDMIIDPYKVTIIFREFFWSEHVHSIMIRDILDIVIETSLFFATVKIVDQGYIENIIEITYLKKSDALIVRKIIQGLVIAHRQSVDLSIMNPSDIKNKTEELGKVKGYDD